VNSLYESEAISAAAIHSPHPDAAGTDSGIAVLDRQGIASDLNESGNAVRKQVLTSGECEALSSLYSSDELFQFE
jgi:hypothetical protein